MRDNESFYRNMIEIVESKNGECLLVHLTATRATLEKRIGADSRKQLKKIATKERLAEWQRVYPESFEKIDYPSQITIDTSDLLASDAAEKIAALLFSYEGRSFGTSPNHIDASNS